MEPLPTNLLRILDKP
jgi:hypothetical protein